MSSRIIADIVLYKWNSDIDLYLKAFNILFNSFFAYRYVTYFLAFKFLLEMDIKSTRYDY